jgi:hypothetical protein
MSFRCVSNVGDDTKRRGDNDVGGGLRDGAGTERGGVGAKRGWEEARRLSVFVEYQRAQPRSRVRSSVQMVGLMMRVRKVATFD